MFFQIHSVPSCAGRGSRWLNSTEQWSPKMISIEFSLFGNMMCCACMLGEDPAECIVHVCSLLQLSCKLIPYIGQ